MIAKRIIAFFFRLYYSRVFKGSWIISDRQDAAQDNGILLYNYLRANKPHLNIFFVLSKSSSDYATLKKRGVKVIDYGSREHWYSILYADVEITAFYNFSRFENIKTLRHKPLIRVYIGHGMTFSDGSEHKSSFDIDILSVDNLNIYNFYLQNKGYKKIDPKKLFLGGMPRIDLIKTKSKVSGVRNNIVIAPTWRRFLKFKPGTSERVNLNDATYSHYMKTWTEVMNSGELLKLSKNNKIIFLLHPEMEAFQDLIHFPEYAELITYSDCNTDRLYDLASRTKLFITDFSSTVFDFAYLGSGIVHYPFDEERYYSNDHGAHRGWFDPDQDGFGPVFRTTDELLNYLDSISGSKKILIDKKYRNNVKKVMAGMPDSSSEAIYRKTMEIIERRNEI